MRWLKNKSACCGCGACAQICPRNCIIMKEDEEGFLYPVVDYEICIQCGLCEKACPAIHRCKRKTAAKVYAAASKDEELVSRSSSGGMFGVLAEYILNKNGVIFGVAFNETLEPVHQVAETAEDYKKLHGSKYIQSNTRNTFAECKAYLDAGRYVLYTGTPCQIAGLRQYLQKDYDKLLAVELICHGVPSPGMWRQYIKELEEESGHRITNAAFRYKDKGWKEYRFRTEYENGEERIVSGSQSPFLKAFFNNLTLRPSCYECRYRIEYTKSDLMIGDFWGVGKYYQHFDEQLGVSALLVLSDKGKRVFEEIKDDIDFIESDMSKLTPMNGCVRLSVFPNRNRKEIAEVYGKGDRITEVLDKCAKNYFWGEQKYSMGVWGSYNTRLVTQFLIVGSRQRRVFHYSNSSVVSLMSDEMTSVDEVVIENEYRKEALTADWKKDFRKQFDRVVGQADYILIDMLEERFDLFRCGSTYITESDALKELDTCFDMDAVTQEDLLESGVWNDKMQLFVQMLESKYTCRQIMILELYLNEVYFDGKEYKEFPNVQEIRKTNSVLKRIYNLFFRYCSTAHRITLGREQQYSHYNHRYGCIPSHLNYDACYKLADQIYDIMVGKDE